MYARTRDAGELMLLAFADRDTHTIFPPQIVAERSVGAVEQAWSRARALQLGPPPARIRVATEDLRALVQASCGPAIEVVVAATPEFDALQEFVASAARDEAPVGTPAYFHHAQPVPPALIRSFFTAVDDFRRAQPWRTIAAESFLDLDIPELAVTRACVSVIADEGLGGLEIFATRRALQESIRGRLTSPLDVLAVMLFHRRQLPRSLRRELGRLPFAPAQGPIPALTATDVAGVWRPLCPRDYEVAIAALTAVSRFAAALEGGAPDLLGVTEVIDSGRAPLEVKLAFSLAVLAPEVELLLH